MADQITVDQRGVLTRCPSCGSTNRLPYAALARRVRCGKCQTTLDAPSSPIEVSGAFFDAMISTSSVPVVVDFWAPWCGPCRVVSPILADMADEHDRVKFVKLNVDENPETQARYNVLSIPTVILFEAGEARETVIGARSRSHYEGAWERWLSPAA